MRAAGGHALYVKVFATGHTKGTILVNTSVEINYVTTQLSLMRARIFDNKCNRNDELLNSLCDKFIRKHQFQYHVGRNDSVGNTSTTSASPTTQKT